jgi:nitrite reductase/ring-hydroxylating ferredoxin subunit
MMGFLPVASLEELPPGSTKLVEVEGRDIVLVNCDGRVYALDNRCPHQGGPLNKGTLDGDTLVCPWHGWRWDASTGRARWPSVEWRVSRLPVKIEDSTVFLRLP